MSIPPTGFGTLSESEVVVLPGKRENLKRVFKGKNDTSLSVDEGGREHRGKGEGGGQFVKKSTNGAGAQDAKGGNTKIKPGGTGEIRSRVLDAAEALKKRRTFFGMFSAKPNDATKSGMVAERSKELKGYRSDLARELPDKETVERKKSGVRSVNEVYFDKKADGTRTIYKPEAKYSQAPSINYDHNVSEAAREVATFKLAEVIGATDLVPATAWTAGQAGDRTTGRATVQEFVPGVSGMKFTGGRASGITKLDKGMAKRALMLDILTGNNDRHAGNWFVNGAEHIHLIDNGRAFPDRDDVYHYYDQGWYGTMINETVPEEVSEWYDKRGDIDKVLEENGMSKSARAGVQKRLEALNKAKGRKFGSLSFKTDDGRLLDYQLFYG